MDPPEAADQSAVIPVNTVSLSLCFSHHRDCIAHLAVSLCPPLPGAVVVYGGSACLPMALDLSEIAPRLCFAR